MTDPEHSPVERLALPLLGVVVGVGLVLRLWTFGDYWINPDEGIYYSMTSWSSWSTFWTGLADNAHPPLYYLIVRAVSGLSIDFAALRSVALVFGCGCVVGAFLLARAWAGRGAVGVYAGLVAALLFAVSPTLVEQSQLIRPYTMLVCALLFGLWFLVRFLDTAKGLAGYVGCMAVAMLTHYSAFLFLGALAVALAVMWGTRRLTRDQVRALLVWNVPLVAVSSVLFTFHMQAMATSDLASGALADWLEPFLIDGIGGVWPRLLAVFELLLGRPLQGPGLLVFVAGLLCAARRQRWLLVGLPVAMLGLAVAASWAQKYPFGSTRHSLYLMPVLAVPLAVAIAHGLAAGGRHLVLTLVAVGVLAAGSPWISPAMGADVELKIRERSLSNAGMEECQGIFDNAKRTPGLLILPLQAYYQLLPLFAAESQSAEWSQDRTLRRFRWGQRDVLVTDEWRIRVAPDQRGTPAHLVDLVRAADAGFPDLRVSQRRRVVFFFAGWTDEGQRLDALRGADPNDKFVVRAAGVPGFSAVEFELGRYLQREGRDRRDRRGR